MKEVRTFDLSFYSCRLLNIVVVTVQIWESKMGEDKTEIYIYMSAVSCFLKRV